MRKGFWLVLVWGLEAAAQAPHAMPPLSLEQGAAQARKLPGLGNVHRKITTRNPEAQAYFDQGLALYYGFNQEEAFRSFAKAAQLDPGCAFCFYAASLSLGPNYNLPMLPEAAAATYDAKQKALKLLPQASDVERALIEALAVRYPQARPLPVEAQAKANLAYAEKMKGVAARFPEDPDVQTLYAEALMDLNPWKLWNKKGNPAPGTLEIVATLERILRTHPDHVGANHLYVHAVEASPHPEKALASADRLSRLVPGAGHLVHMPSHTYQRMGRYEDAAEANRKAIVADRNYLQRGQAPEAYRMMYVAHNQSFLAYTAAMEGRAQEAVGAAQEASSAVTPEAAAAMPPMEFFAAQGVVTQAGLGLWEEVLKAKGYPASMPVAQGLWLHARGLALLESGKTAEAKSALEQLRKIRQALPAGAMAGLNSARDLLGIAEAVLKGKLLLATGKKEEGLSALQTALYSERALSYAEPPDWWYPLPPVLGQALLKAGSPQEAERVFRSDLVDHPKHAAALLGLSQALAAQGKSADAQAAQEEFRRAWSRADLPQPPVW